MATKYLDSTGLTYLWGKLKAYFQPKLVSGTNIKTINNESLLGSGDISISGGGVTPADYVTEQGTSGIWSYRKWNSGIVEMWGNAQSLTVSGGYYTVPLPFTVLDYPVVNITGWYGTDSNRDAVSVYQTYGGLVNNSIVVYVRTYAGAVISSGYGRASIYLYGRWK